jgi:hypothetical protein
MLCSLSQSASPVDPAHSWSIVHGHSRAPAVIPPTLDLCPSGNHRRRPRCKSTNGTDALLVTSIRLQQRLILLSYRQSLHCAHRHRLARSLVTHTQSGAGRWSHELELLLGPSPSSCITRIEGGTAFWPLPVPNETVSHQRRAPPQLLERNETCYWPATRDPCDHDVSHRT